MSRSPSIHANCVVCGERGILVFGASGAGKSGFSAALLARARAAGRFARLVADDRVLLSAAHGRLIARPHPALAGLMERRGLGIVGEPHLAATVVRLVIELDPEAERLPAPEAMFREIEGVRLPALALDPRDPEAPGHALRSLEPGLNMPNCDRFALAFAPQHEKIARSAS
ncbi:HPr kinase/phosphorylase [Chenggangzhangella methanolivorans]|uniref:Serine kinase n=1 Tax=Chenggangzhangella methanolivorans TaxID=1437009 RepID=A0A9E6RCA0_9HYPH|nr:serine kinase [Chenggangzhangella methanolivorans]QZO01215.1 serine kinase [Chenggangzhangella methanolivorans]